MIRYLIIFFRKADFGEQHSSRYVAKYGHFIDSGRPAFLKAFILPCRYFVYLRCNFGSLSCFISRLFPTKQNKIWYWEITAMRDDRDIFIYYCFWFRRRP